MDMFTARQPVSRLALGMAALGRPSYITLDHAEALGDDRSVEALRSRSFAVLDAAYSAGIRHVDVARSYGLAEDFLESWLEARGEVSDVFVSSKWGYRYVGDWQVDAQTHEAKDHSLATFREQWTETRSRLGARVQLYQVHSVTPESPVLRDRALLEHLAELRDLGIGVGLSTSGPGQSAVVREALGVTVGGEPVFSAVQATWNLLESSTTEALSEAAAAGWWVIIKEVLANGRLAGSAAPAPLTALADDAGTTADAVAIAVALALPWRPTVLLGPVSIAQLSSNLAALCADGNSLAGCVSGMAQSPAAYWEERSSLPWH